jgi:hypothetical protein
MRKTYQLLLALVVSAISFTSCSHGDYAANQHSPAPLSSQQLAPATFTTADLELTARVTAQAAAPTPEIASVALAAPSASKANALVVAVPKAVHSGLVQRLALKKVTKQLAKIQAGHQNIAQVEQTASKAGSAGLVILAGLVVILIGGLIGGANIVVTIGGVIFVVGLVLLVLALIRA